MTVYKSGNRVLIEFEISKPIGLERKAILIPQKATATLRAPDGHIALQNVPADIDGSKIRLEISPAHLTIPGGYTASFVCVLRYNIIVTKDISFRVAPKNRPEIRESDGVRQMRRRGIQPLEAQHMLDGAADYDTATKEKIQ